MSLRRKTIHEKCVVLRLGSGFFRSLAPGDLEFLFAQYDAMFFGRAFARLVEDTGAVFRFSCSGRTRGSVAAFRVGAREILVEVAPILAAELFFARPHQLREMLGRACADTLEALQLVFEHLLVHLAVVLFDTRSEAGALLGFADIADAYFRHWPEKPAGGGEACRPEGPAGPRACTPGGECLLHLHVCADGGPGREYAVARPAAVYHWRDNSCYLDALLMLVLTCACPVWRRTFAETDVASVDYAQLARVSGVASAPRIRRLAQELQGLLRADFAALSEGGGSTPPDSGPVRAVLREFLPAMQSPAGAWANFGAVGVYDLLADLFPGVRIEVPSAIVKAHRRTRTQRRRQNLLQMWEFMDTFADTEGDYEEILWDRVCAPILVFQNGGAVVALDKTDDEVNVVQGKVAVLQKSRAFAETILRGRYRLVGVVTLRGVGLGADGGTHYVCYILLPSGPRGELEWHLYNSIGPVFRRTGLPMSGVWRETRGNKPELYFYARVDTLPPQN